MRRLFTIIFLTSLVFSSLAIATVRGGQQEKSGFQRVGPPVPAEQWDFLLKRLAIRQKQFQVVSKVFRQSGIALDPAVLFAGNWRQALAAQIGNVPQLQANRVVPRNAPILRGALVANRLTLPEQLTIADDTVIVANDVVFTGNIVNIKGHHHIFIFAVNAVRLPDPKWGNITIDTSGYGYDEWLADHGDPSLNDAGGIDFSSDNGAPGATGSTGEDGRPGADASEQAASGSCGGRPAGAAGVSGGPGLDGGMGGQGLPGKPGGNAGNIVMSAAEISVNTSWVFIANGGKGGKGGMGGNGGTGGTGGKGQTGGDGTLCLCNDGQRIYSGPGGAGGDAGSGGRGGEGGIGGQGGKGGDVFVTLPVSYNPDNIFCHQSRGLGGDPGDGGSQGVNGLQGTPGLRGDMSRLPCLSKVGHLREFGRPGRPAINKGNGERGTTGQPGDSDGEYSFNQEVAFLEPGPTGGNGCTPYYWVLYVCYYPYTPADCHKVDQFFAFETCPQQRPAVRKPGEPSQPSSPVRLPRRGDFHDF